MYPCSLSALVPPTTDDPEKKKRDQARLRGPTQKLIQGLIGKALNQSQLLNSCGNATSTKFHYDISVQNTFSQNACYNHNYCRYTHTRK